MEMESEKLCAELMETTATLPINDGGSSPPEAVAVPDVNMLQESDDGKSWMDQLNMLKKKIEALQENYDQSYLEIGKVLIKARDIYKGHGNWIGWLKENVPFSVRHAQRLIRVAEMFGDATLVSQLGLTASKAYVLTKVGKEDIRTFHNTFFPVGDKKKSVNTMTRRELEVVVATFLRDKLAPTNHEDVPSNQGEESMKASVESDFEELKKALNKTIASIKGSDSDTRESWISALEELYQMGLDELLPEPK